MVCCRALLGLAAVRAIAKPMTSTRTITPSVAAPLKLEPAALTLAAGGCKALRGRLDLAGGTTGTCAQSLKEALDAKPLTSDCVKLFIGLLLMGLPKPVRIGGSDTVKAAAAAVPAAASANGLSCALVGSVAAASLPNWCSCAVTSGPCILSARVYTDGKVSTALLQSPGTPRGGSTRSGTCLGGSCEVCYGEALLHPINLARMCAGDR